MLSIFLSFHSFSTLTRKNRPRNNDVTLFTALVVVLDIFLLGWRPHDLDPTYFPFSAGIGLQVGTSDPVFMR